MADTTPSKDRVKIIYYAGDRTFARLFKERSLDEVKDVVRRKLGLGSQTDVSLKHMAREGLIDLEDDDDFQAFCVHLSPCASVDIKVTVGKSLGSTVPPPVSRGPVTHMSPSKLTTTTEASATPAKASEPPKRKRQVSLDGAAVAVSVESTEQHAPARPTAVTPPAFTETAETLATPKPVAFEEHPKKKQRKEPTKARTKAADIPVAEAAESPSTKTSVSKPRTKKSATLDRGSKAEISAPKVAETSELPAKKPKRQKKDDSTARKKTSASADLHGADQPSGVINEAPLQLGGVDSSRSKHVLIFVEKPTGLGAEGDTPKTRKSEKIKPPKGTACAAIPQTSASVNVQSEVAAAILSGYLSKASETVPPEPPAKRKSVKRVIKKSSGSSKALPAEPTTMLDVPAANEVLSAPAEHRIEQEVPTNRLPQQHADLDGPSCPICSEAPFHIRHYCPTVLKGPDAIRERLEEVKRTDVGDQHPLIKQLEDLLRDPKVIPESSSDAASTDGMQSRRVPLAPSASFFQTTDIPNIFYLSEVAVESKDEGSSLESSDDMSEGRVNHREFPISRRQETQDVQPLLLPSNGDLEAIVRGPASRKQSILQLLDRIVGDEDEEDMEDRIELEEDPDEETGRSRRLPSRRTTRCSDSESEADFQSPLLSRSVEGTSDNVGLGPQSPKKSGEKSAERQEGDVVMKDSVAALEVVGVQDDDGSEETHVGSEDHMVVDESTGEREEKGATTVTGEPPSSPVSRASVAQPSDGPCDEPQESANAEVEPTPDRDNSVPAASEVVGDIPADPIEPADDLAPPDVSCSLNADPIEVPFQDIDSLFPSVASSTPKSGVSKRIKTRNGRILDDEADRPVLLEQLDLEVTDKLTAIPPIENSRRKTTDTPASQEPVTTRRSARFSSLPPSTSTPAAVALLNHRSKSGARGGKVAKTPAKQSEKRIAATPSLIQWETLAEPSSPPVQPDEPSAYIDELMSSSPHPNDNLILGRPNGKEKKGRTRRVASSSQAQKSQEKERLFDPSSSQIPFPYSQNLTNSVTATVSNGKDKETTDSEDELKVAKKRTKTPTQYRTLSQLASQAALFSPSLPAPMPTKTLVSNGRAEKDAIVEETSSESSSDADEANGLEHIPRERRAGSILEAKKRKGLLSGI